MPGVLLLPTAPPGAALRLSSWNSGTRRAQPPRTAALHTPGAAPALRGAPSGSTGGWAGLRHGPPRKGGLVICSAASDAAGAGLGMLEKTWSNPEGNVLTPVAPNVWAAERPFMWNKIDVGGKMAVIKLSDGCLWVHSPVDLDDALRQEIDKLGPVKHIVSPNFEHLKYAEQWITAYPDAIGYGCPGLLERKPETGYKEELAGSSAPAAWKGEIESCSFAGAELNPFTGKPFFNEVLFCHVPTGTLVVTDVFWNYPGDAPAGTKLWKFGMDKVYLPFYCNLMVQRSQFDDAVGVVMGWPWDAILPCHGSYFPRGGKEELGKHLGL